MPQIKQQVTQAVEVSQKSMNQIDMKSVSNKISKAVQLIKNKISSLKKSSQNDEIQIKVNNKEASKQISQLEKEIESLQKKVSERELKLNVTNGALDKMRDETKQSVIKDMPDAGAKRINQNTELRLYQNDDYTALEKQSNKLNSEIARYNALLESAKEKLSQLKQETNQTGTSQNKLTSFFSTFKGKLDQAKGTVSGLKNNFNQIPKITQKITNNIKNMGTGLKSGLKHVLRYAMALFSLRGIYSVLSNSAQSWLSSQNKGAQQLSANIEYMKYAMGSVFAPVIEYVINLVYQLMKAIQSLVYAFSGINIFAKATASSMNKTAGSASKASKSLAGVHNEINNVSENDNSSGSGSATPSMDLSTVDSQMSSFAQKLYDFFKPLKESWDTYGTGLVEQIKTTASQVVELVSSVWGSFENVITNGTVYSILGNILAIIGNIAQAFANAWNYNGNGDKIIQTMADMLDNVSQTIKDIAGSQGFQDFLNGVSTAFSGILTFIEPVLDDFLALVEPIAEIALSAIGTVLEAIGNALKWIGDNEIAVTILESLAIAIGIVTVATTAFKAVKALETSVLIANAAAWIAANWPILLIIAAITAVIAIIILCVKNWDTIKETVINVCNKVKETVSEWVEKIKTFFTELKDKIVNKVTEIKDTIVNKFTAIKDKALEIFNNIKSKISEIWNNITTTISNVVTTIKDKVSTAFTNIKDKITTIMNNVKTTLSNIWNGIWSTIKGVINSIIGGVEKMCNMVIRGINKILTPLTKVGNAILEAVGIKSFSFSTIAEISLPRLAKGNVAYSETVAVFGEYAGASNNPEITTPQNVMAETFRDVLSDYQYSNNSSNGELKQIVVQFGSTKVALEIERLLQQARRQNGTAYAII